MQHTTLTPVSRILLEVHDDSQTAQTITATVVISTEGKSNIVRSKMWRERKSNQHDTYKSCTCRVLPPLVREVPRFVTGVWWRGRNRFRLDCQRGNGEKEHPRRGTLGKCQQGKKH